MDVPLPEAGCLPSSPSPSPQTRAPVGQDRARGVVAWRSGHASARMGARSAVIEPCDWSSVIGVAQHRACGEQLVERERAVKAVAPDEPEHALEIEWAQDLAAEHAGLEPRGITLDCLNHQIGHLLAALVPGSPIGEHGRDVLAE